MIRWTILLLGIPVVLLCSCKSRYFGSMSSVREQLIAHESDYTSAGEMWNSQPRGMMFGYYGNDHYRWGDLFVDRLGNGYGIGQGSNNSIVVPDLKAAAARAGTSDEELREWIALAQRLKIYSIKKTYPAEGGYIQIDLWGSEWSPYGLRYAPAGNDAAFQGLLEDLKTNDNKRDDILLRPLKGRWFYFESTRF